MTLETEVFTQMRQARSAGRLLALASAEHKNRALAAIADTLRRRADEILVTNQGEVEKASVAGLGNALIDRLTLNRDRIAAIARSVQEVIALPDPVGETMARWT